MLPLVGVPTNQREAAGLPHSVTPRSIIDALVQVAGVLPVLLPALTFDQVRPLLDGTLSGILLTGGPSHVGPHHYGSDADMTGCELDPERDALTLPLVRHAQQQGIPLFGICRGMQEMNVALGGTLQHNIHELPGKQDHRSDKSIPDWPSRYRKLAHNITMQPGGRLLPWLGERAMVNSLHDQGMATLAPALTLEAVADDGVVEAFSIPAHPYFIGTQWHPEWDTTTHAVNRKLFEEFGAAVRQRMEERS
jgi:putative glutamine amidotransferase